MSPDARAAAGAAFLDAPISGGVPGAEEGTLTIMVGGDPAVLEQVRPIFAVLGTHIQHVGPSGAGTVVKLANQLMVAVNVAGAVEALALVARAGVDPVIALEVLLTSFGTSRTLDRTGPLVLNRDFTPRTPVDIIAKDLSLILAVTKQLGVPTVMAGAAGEVFTTAQARGLGGEDMVATIKLLESASGVEVRPASA